VYRNGELNPEKRVYPGGYFDPLALASDDSDRTAKLREAEIKHGRLAMIAFLVSPLPTTLEPVLGRDLHSPYAAHSQQEMRPSDPLAPPPRFATLQSRQTLRRFHGAKPDDH